MKRYKTNHVLFSKGIFTESEVMRFYNNLISKKTAHNIFFVDGRNVEYKNFCRNLRRCSGCRNRQWNL